MIVLQSARNVDSPLDMPFFLVSSNLQTLVDATMYIYFRYAYKPGFYSSDDSPYVKHEAQLHMVLLPWNETEATSTYRLNEVAWSTQYLALDGTDANAAVIGSNTMHIGQPSRLMAFDVRTTCQLAMFYGPLRIDAVGSETTDPAFFSLLLNQ